MSAALRLVRLLIFLAILGAGILFARQWLADHPQHNPWAPLDLRDPRGIATDYKLNSLIDDPASCRAVLDRSAVDFTGLAATGQGACARPDRLTLDEAVLKPAAAQITCPVAAALTVWIEKDLQPLAREILGSEVTAIDHLGTYSCRRINGASTGNWSEHATGNAIDIGGFRLADGRTIRVLSDWAGDDVEARFLRAARDAACQSFATVLSPEYNAAHADHFHLDQAKRTGHFSVCR